MIFYACIGLNMHLGSNSFGVDISWYFIHVSDWICIFKFKCIWSWYTLTSSMHRSDLNLCKRRKVYIKAYIYLTWYMQWIKYALDFKYIEVDMWWSFQKINGTNFQNQQSKWKLGTGRPPGPILQLDFVLTNAVIDSLYTDRNNDMAEIGTPTIRICDNNLTPSLKVKDQRTQDA